MPQNTAQTTAQSTQAPAAAPQATPAAQMQNTAPHQRPMMPRDYAYSRAQQAQPQQQAQQKAVHTPATNTKPATTQNTNEGQAMSNPNDNNAQANPAAPRPMDIPGTMPYGRPMTPAAMGGYGTSSHAAYNPYGSGRKLIIGEGITMSGEIEHCDHLIVEGTVQATLKDAKLLDISEAGVFYGTVDIEEATIAGRFEGDINVAGRLTVKAAGVITGSIRYKELAIEAGATIEGTLSPVGPRKGDDNVAAADFSKGKAVAKQAREAAQKSADQLPFADKGAVSAAQ